MSILTTSLAALLFIQSTFAAPSYELERRKTSTRMGSRTKRLVGGAIAGIIIGAIVLLLLLVLCCVFACRRGSKNNVAASGGQGQVMSSRPGFLSRLGMGGRGMGGGGMVGNGGGGVMGNGGGGMMGGGGGGMGMSGPPQTYAPAGRARNGFWGRRY